ncbi:hypothetical protein SEA_PATIO_70 [Gordonia phage Patio]|uniref:POU-specific domain-containing protein n=2 Tax=Skysandvirus TaxID=2948912 RepID=A0A2D2W4P5_9CAUD|nr:hypothetical protein KNT76_gp70 [Gordonia phage Patio]YP_010103179.1 hypothetical protein KNU64_gp72 [Gordonia Phage Lollipop1437]ATS93151.1 hypothetical protein SEA_PATIO_70 [Gordonia phage Patio]QDF19176.1 hypothetical protein SEA_LOLLIPOP1437_72 [Gordonia Phage Lollipop1437]QRI45310.1 hypothetical protein SEA_ENNEA_75 [Gordonia phage Ennea]
MSKLSPLIKKWAEESFGPVSDILSTVTFENGTGGHHVTVIGHELSPRGGNPTDQIFVLPLKYVGAGADDDKRFNRGDAPRIDQSVLARIDAINTARIIRITVETYIRPEGSDD